MIRSLWLLVKVGVMIGIVVWLADRPGTISIDWLDYKIRFHVGIFLLMLLGMVMLGIFLFGIIKAILDFPKTYSRYRGIMNKDKGMRALTLGLSAVAAGDTKNAVYQSHRATQFLHEDEPLPKLLAAQAARLDGRDLDAAKSFMALLEHKDTAFLGVRGLLQTTLDSGDYAGSLELARKALEMQPHRAWILRMVYDLEIRHHLWTDALKTLYRAEKNGAIPTNKANSDRVAMLLAQADEAKKNGQEEVLFRTLQKALKIDPRFVPTVERLALMYLERGKRKAAIHLLEDTWKFLQHPSLIAVWGKAFVSGKTNDPMDRVRWYEKLVMHAPESVEALQAMAGVLIQEGLWGEARKNLEKAETLRPNVELYKLWARLEERATHDDMAVRRFLEKAADAPRERVWICSETGRIYDRWMPISDQGLFNTIIWDFPSGRAGVSSLMFSGGVAPDLMLEAQKS